MNTDKALACFAWTGALLLCTGTYLHPMQADPNQPLAAFAEYAASRHWVASHLLQLLGVVGITAALVLLAHRLIEGKGAVLARLGHAGAVASLAMAGALQAVDGIALKAMVDSWAAAGSDKTAAFHAALAVRHIEIGLAGISSLISSLSFLVLGLALRIDGRLPAWLGWLGVAGGLGMAAAGVAIAYTGFSEWAMNFNMPASLLLMIWLVALGALSWRQWWSRPPSS